MQAAVVEAVIAVGAAGTGLLLSDSIRKLTGSIFKRPNKTSVLVQRGDSMTVVDTSKEDREHIEAMVAKLVVSLTGDDDAHSKRAEHPDDSDNAEGADR